MRKLYTIKYSNDLYQKDETSFTWELNEAIISSNIEWLNAVAERALMYPDLYRCVAGCSYNLVEVKIVEV